MSIWLEALLVAVDIGPLPGRSGIGSPRCTPSPAGLVSDAGLRICDMISGPVALAPLTANERRKFRRTAIAAGVDTWSLAWYVEANSFAADALSKLATVPGPRSKLLPESIRDHRVGWFPGASLAFAEGHPNPGGLCRPCDLQDAFAQLQAAMADHGLIFTPSRAKLRRGDGDPVVEPGFAGLRRLDLTADLAFDSAAEGLAVLSGVAALSFPRMGKRVQFQPGGRAVETVYVLGPGGKRVLGRWYDKGNESGAAARGLLIRPEDQRRFTGKGRIPVEAVGPELARGLFQRRFMPLWRASEGVIVGTSPELVKRVAELVEAGELTPRVAHTLIGHLVADSVGLDELWLSARQVREHRARARRYGLVLADGVIDECEVDLHGAIEAALEAEDWYAEG